MWGRAMWEVTSVNGVLEVFVAAALTLMAIWRFGSMFWTYQADPVKQAKKYGMTEEWLEGQI